MRHLSIFAALLVCGVFAILSAQDNRVFDWTPANGETIPLEPASLHSGRIYHPAAGGGNMHVQIDSRYPVTVAMAWGAWPILFLKSLRLPHTSRVFCGRVGLRERRDHFNSFPSPGCPRTLDLDSPLRSCRPL